MDFGKFFWLSEIFSTDGMQLLDTEKGSKAEKVYPKLGYVEYGTIPDYSVSPDGLVLKSETFFYKDLRAVPPTVN
jgi:hypothetical protein